MTVLLKQSQTIAKEEHYYTVGEIMNYKQNIFLIVGNNETKATSINNHVVDAEDSIVAKNKVIDDAKNNIYTCKTLKLLDFDFINLTTYLYIDTAVGMLVRRYNKAAKFYLPSLIEGKITCDFIQIAKEKGKKEALNECSNKYSGYLCFIDTKKIIENDLSLTEENYYNRRTFQDYIKGIE